jgi:2,5-dioxopentanoate dehydrogenase
MKLTGNNLIGSNESGKGKSFKAKNPTKNVLIEPSFFEATSEEIDQAISKANQAFKIYRNVSGIDRANFLEKIAEEIVALGDDLIQRCMEETALPEARLVGERGRTVNQLKLFAKLIREGSWVGAKIDKANPDRQPLPMPDIRQMQIALGPVGVFGASNFPLAFSVAGGDTVSALAAGCPVVFKAHPLHPGTSEMVGKAIIKAAQACNMPEGVFSMVQGGSTEVGKAIVLHPQITAIGFTGSYQGGKALSNLANSRAVPIPVFAEMGSSNPVFILPKILKEQAKALSKGLVGSINLGVGQFCTNPGIIITPKSADTDVLAEDMKAQIEQLKPAVMLGEGLKSNYQNGLERLIKEGSTALATGQKDESEGVASQLMMVAGADFIKNPDLGKEVFGPSSLIVKTNGKDELLQLAEGLKGHLTATIHGTEEDLREYAELIQILELKVGRIIYNGYPTGVEVCHSMIHGGPYPATSAPQTTSVGTGAIHRFARPVCYQDFPQFQLPDALKNENPLEIWRLVDGVFGKH